MNSNKKQQWEMLASEGHVLLARVNVYRLKFKFAFLMLIVPFLLAAVTISATPKIAKVMGDVVGWVVGKVSSAVSVKPAEKSEAAFVNQYAAVFVGTISIDAKTVVVPSLKDDVTPAMKALVESASKNQRMTDCDFTKKITDSWTDGIDMTPKCRYSKDFSRLWVWSVVLDEGRLKPFSGLVAKRNDKVTFFNVYVPRGGLIPGEPTVFPKNLPRTIAADFPELL